MKRPCLEQTQPWIRRNQSVFLTFHISKAPYEPRSTLSLFIWEVVGQAFMESKVWLGLFVCLYEPEKRVKPSWPAEIGKVTCEWQTWLATSAGGETTLTHLLGSPVSVAEPCKSSSPSSLTLMARCLWLSLMKSVVVTSQGKAAAHGCQMGWDWTVLEQPLLRDALERCPS